MAALAHLAASTASPLPDFNSSLELEFDSFLNLDQSTYPTSESMKSDPSLISQPSVETPDVNASASDLAPSFSAPSHQYGDHPQQTGFPPNAIAHAMAYNENSLGVLQAGNQGYATPSQNFMHVKRENPSMDSRFVSLRSKSDVNFDTDSANLTNFMNSQPSVTRNQSFVNPTALAGNGMPMNVQLVPQAGRVYPGMHQQQAMARAMHQQRQGLQSAQHHMRQQQQQQQQQMQHNQFGQFANSGPSQPLSSNRPARPTDPIVEERISRLLQQMRQNGQNSESHQNSSNSLLPQIAKHKKDEEDMDEDERLLASEEGKKLTSKERRQLRNKVSARAFRSRRKEYITQLEGEVAAKASENNELRLQNQALMEENSRLTDLTRMLLSNPQFSDVLNELSVSGLPQTQVQASTPTSQPQPQLQPQPQHQFQHQLSTSQTPLPMSVTTSNSSSNMAMVQDSGVDFYGAGWNSGIDMNYNPSIFAVVQVPDAPAVDFEMISGKTCPFSLPGFTEPSSKLEIPQLERPAVPKASPISKSDESETSSTEPLDETDPCFTLFVDSIPLSSNNPSTAPLNFQAEKPSQYKTVVDHGSENPSDSLQRLKQICSSMDAAYERVCQLTDYLL